MRKAILLLPQLCLHFHFYAGVVIDCFTTVQKKVRMLKVILKWI